MSRQINLYSSAFQHQAKKFSAVWTVAAAVAIAAGMSADYAWEAHQMGDLRARRSAAEVQLKELREQLLALGKDSPRTTNKALEDQVAQAENLLKIRQELFGRLQSGEIGNRDGYGKFLIALARQRLEGLWLTSIEISGPGSDFAIEGRTLRADLVPGYIKMLSREDVLRGKSIGTLSMREREIDPKGEQAAHAGAARGAPVQAGQGAQAGQGGQAVPAGQQARPDVVRVVEFTIGTGGTGGAGTGKGAGTATAAGGASP